LRANESSYGSPQEANLPIRTTNHRFCRTLRRTWEGRELSDQLFRAGTRVGANDRAACRGRSHADFVAKLGLVVEETDEAIYWLELISAAGIAAGSELQSLLDEANELSRIFQPITVDRQEKRGGTANDQPRSNGHSMPEGWIAMVTIRKFAVPKIRQSVNP
jgi:four helix bundle protein